MVGAAALLAAAVGAVSAGQAISSGDQTSAATTRTWHAQPGASTHARQQPSDSLYTQGPVQVSRDTQRPALGDVAQREAALRDTRLPAAALNAELGT
ncbi:MAG: hypothetical protein ACRDPG_08170, partial [Nocardioidaceae bacterium]